MNVKYKYHFGFCCALLVLLLGCHTAAVQTDESHHALHLCNHRQPAEVSETIEVGGLVRAPGLMPVPDGGLQLAQVLIRSGGVDPAIRGNAPHHLFVAVRQMADGEPVTTYFPLPLVEQGLAGAVQVPVDSRVTVVDRQDTAVDPSYTRRERILSLSGRQSQVRIRGLRIAPMMANVGELLDAANPALSTSQIGGSSLRGAVTFAQRRFPQSNPSAGVAVISRRSLEGLGLERFILALDEPLAPDSTQAAEAPPTNAVGAAPAVPPQPVAVALAQPPAPGVATTPRQTNRPAPSPRAAGIVTADLIAEVLGTQSGAPAQPAVQNAPGQGASAQVARRSQNIDSQIPYVNRVALLNGDDVELVPLPLVPEVLTGIVTSRTKARVAQRMRPLERRQQEREAAREAREESASDSTFSQVTEPVTRVVSGVGESTRQAFGLLAP